MVGDRIFRRAHKCITMQEDCIIITVLHLVLQLAPQSLFAYLIEVLH